MIGPLVLTLLALVAMSEAIVCPANYCAAVDCVAVTACDGKIVQNGGFCGCCDVCKRVLNPGESCFQMFLMGVPSTVTCPDNYHCDAATHTCTPVA